MEQDRAKCLGPAGLNIWENARLFGLLNLASADAYIADFANKYLYEFWRPITAIRAADTDGNPETVADPTWDSLVPSPPAPDYPSGHSGQGGAMSEVLARFFGDKVSFGPPPRRSRASRVHSRASPKRRKKTVTRASTSDFTSDTQSQRELNWVVKWVKLRSITICDRFSNVVCGSGAQPHTCLLTSIGPQATPRHRLVVDDGCPGATCDLRLHAEHLVGRCGS